MVVGEGEGLGDGNVWISSMFTDEGEEGVAALDEANIMPLPSTPTPPDISALTLEEEHERVEEHVPEEEIPDLEDFHDEDNVIYADDPVIHYSLFVKSIIIIIITNTQGRISTNNNNTHHSCTNQ